MNAVFFATIVNKTNLPSTFIFQLFAVFVIGIAIAPVVSLLIFPLFATIDFENRVNYSLTNLQQMHTILIQTFLYRDEMAAQVSLAQTSVIEQTIRTAMSLMNARLKEARMELSRCLQRIFNRRRRHLFDLTIEGYLFL
jgi:uncharacterized membrane protein YccC